MGLVAFSSWIPAHKNLLMMVVSSAIKVFEKRMVDI